MWVCVKVMTHVLSLESGQVLEKGLECRVPPQVGSAKRYIFRVQCKHKAAPRGHHAPQGFLLGLEYRTATPAGPPVLPRVVEGRAISLDGAALIVVFSAWGGGWALGAQRFIGPV